MLKGRRGHARAIVITIVDEELSAVLDEFAATEEIPGSGCWACAASEDSVYPVLVAQSADRSNMPCAETVRDLVEDWQPEYVILVGIAGGIVRESAGSLKGPMPGDVVCLEYVHYGEYTKRVNGERLLRYYPLAQPSSDLVRRYLRPLARTSWSEQISHKRPEGAGDEPQTHFGEIVALEFLAGDAAAVEQREIFGAYDHALAVDMESAGVARAMHNASTSVHYRPVWIGVRGISDRTAATEAAQELLGADNDAERQRWRDYAAAAAASFARLTVERLLAEARPPQPEDPGAAAWSFSDG